ncbi:RidA family protein [Hymenobacter terricola]|uniref:RidA family protein n=1 Tax=Hymenobacter terricola TaxID=2819236 RepID=UPI001B301FD9|nr:RidA family protein [Hymenobacter terricola]
MQLNGLDHRKIYMTTRKNFNTARVPKMSEVFPQSVIADNLIFLSGTPGLDLSTGQIISADFEEQIRQSFKNIQTILEDAGSNMSKVLKTTIFMVHGNDFSVVNKVYKEFFPENPPARSTPQVMPFPAGILVSVECIAQVE